MISGRPGDAKSVQLCAAMVESGPNLPRLSQRLSLLDMLPDRPLPVLLRPRARAEDANLEEMDKNEVRILRTVSSLKSIGPRQTRMQPEGLVRSQCACEIGSDGVALCSRVSCPARVGYVGGEGELTAISFEGADQISLAHGRTYARYMELGFRI